MPNITYVVPELFEIDTGAVYEISLDDLTEILTTATDPVSLIEHFVSYTAPQGSDTYVPANRVLLALDFVEIPVGPVLEITSGAVMKIGD